VNKHFIILFTLLFSLNVFAQKENGIKIISVDSTVQKKSSKKQERLARREAREIRNIRPYNALAPSKAAFYSAVLPGLGQAYTGKYWKIPIVYGALGTGIGIAIWNENQFNEIRDIYKNRLLGITTDRFFDQETGEAIVSNDALVSAFENHQKQKELSILITVIIYALNIIDANVTAHLQQYNLNKNLAVNPQFKLDDFVTGPNYGLSLSYSF